MTEAAVHLARKRALLRAAAGVLASFVLHTVAVLGVGLYGAMPTIDGEFRIPSEIEFGVAEAIEMAPLPPPSAPTTPPPAAPVSTAGEGEGAAADAGVRPRDGGVDGGVADGSIEGGAGDAASEEGGIEDAGTRPSSGLARGTDGRSRLNPGAHLAMRFDFARIRGSALERPISTFLVSIRDFQMLLGGSGVDPVADLDQFLMASPDPTKRSKYVYVGRLAHDDDWARARVAEIAASRGLPAEWSEIGGHPMAPWHDADDVDRVIVLLGDRYFALCRASDVPSVLGWLASIAEHADRPLSDGPSLALGVADDEVLSLEAENLRAYAQGEVLEHTPLRARLSILAESATSYDLAARADYDDAAGAADGSAYWDEKREALSRNSMVQLVGLDRPLSAFTLTPREEQLRAQTSLTVTDVQALLGAAQLQLADYYRRADARRAAPPP